MQGRLASKDDAIETLAVEKTASTILSPGVGGCFFANYNI
jgi:hypothetical protein